MKCYVLRDVCVWWTNTDYIHEFVNWIIIVLFGRFSNESCRRRQKLFGMKFKLGRLVLRPFLIKRWSGYTSEIVDEGGFNLGKYRNNKGLLWDYFGNKFLLEEINYSHPFFIVFSYFLVLCSWIINLKCVNDNFFSFNILIFFFWVKFFTLPYWETHFSLKQIRISHWCLFPLVLWS